MQFQVPQFIDIEDKIVGPFSLKQFGYLAAAALLIFILFFILKTALWIIVAIPVALFAVALALIKYNGRPLPYLIVSIAKHFWQPRFFLWQHKKLAAAPAIKVPTIKLPSFAKASRGKPHPPTPHKLAASLVGVPTSPPLKPPPSPSGGSPEGRQSLEVGPPPEKKSLLQMLGLKLSAYTHPIPRRERTPEPVMLRTQPEGGAALLRRLMKERELARRVDYR